MVSRAGRKAAADDRATTLRHSREQGRSVIDGPFAETRSTARGLPLRLRQSYEEHRVAKSASGKPGGAHEIRPSGVTSFPSKVRV